MAHFDVEAFVARLDHMGMKLTVVPLADGKLRINCWRMLNAREHIQQIRDLWTTQIGHNQERINILVTYLDKAAPRAVGYGISSDRTRVGSQSTTAPSAASGPCTASDSRSAAASQSGVTSWRLRSAPSAISILAAAASQSVVALQRVVEKAAGVSPAGAQEASAPGGTVGVKNTAGAPKGGLQDER